jgi:hypothetical protein
MAHVDINSYGVNTNHLLYQGYQTLNYSFGRQVKTASQSLGIEFSMMTGKKETEEHKKSHGQDYNRVPPGQKS